MSKPSRKRRHGDDDDDDDDDIPILKRIHKLQIESQKAQENNNIIIPPLQHSGVHSGCNHGTMATMMSDYRPDVSPAPDSIYNNKTVYNTMHSSHVTQSHAPSESTSSQMNNDERSTREWNCQGNSYVVNDNRAPGYNHRGGHGLHMDMPDTHSSSHLNGHVNCIERYSPELDNTQNPFYYDMNKILFDATMSRLLRSNSLP